MNDQENIIPDGGPGQAEDNTGEQVITVSQENLQAMIDKAVAAAVAQAPAPVVSPAMNAERAEQRRRHEAAYRNRRRA